MRNASVATLFSVVVLAGCQTQNGSLDWRRMGHLASSTVLAGGGLLLAGPGGAAAGAEIGSRLFTETERRRPVTHTASTRPVRAPSPPQSAGSAPMASKPQEPAPPAAITVIPASTPGGRAPETLGL